VHVQFLIAGLGPDRRQRNSIMGRKKRAAKAIKKAIKKAVRKGLTAEGVERAAKQAMLKFAEHKGTAQKGRKDVERSLIEKNSSIASAARNHRIGSD